MQLEKTTHYAVRILRHLRTNSDLQRPHMIAEGIGMSPQLVTRLMAKLRKAELVTFVSGRGGGYKLGRPAEEISFYDMFVASEGEFCISHCFKEGLCTEDGHCKAHDFLMKMQENWANDMLGVCLADLD